MCPRNRVCVFLFSKIKQDFSFYLSCWREWPTILDSVSMDQCKNDVSPLLTHWSYVFLALTHRYIGCRHYSPITRFLGPTWAPPGSVGPKWTPCRPQEPCYLGCYCHCSPLSCRIHPLPRLSLLQDHNYSPDMGGLPEPMSGWREQPGSPGDSGWICSVEALDNGTRWDIHEAYQLLM